jgi:RNA polymerase sigma-70 factor (ECF subfamily)
MTPLGQETAGSTAEQRSATDDAELLAALRRGDEAAFEVLIDRYQHSLLRVAMIYVPNRAVAEEVVQETWLGLLRSLNRFEGRASLKTWIFRILTNCARRRGVREARSVPFSTLDSYGSDTEEHSVDPDRFLPADHAQWPGHWATPPQSWGGIPENHLLSQETRAQIEAAIEALPETQRLVINMRDVVGLSADEVCHELGISDANQRVLLHRARSKVRRALETYLDVT